MIGRLPKALEIDGTEYPIRTDYRTVLIIIQALNDVNLTKQEKAEVMLECLYINWESMNVDIEKAVEKAVWFIDGGTKYPSRSNVKLMDWEQDEQIIFSGVNKVAGCEVRNIDYCHWWTFLGYFTEIGEGVFSTYVNIRQKQARGKKLEKYEQEIFNKHADEIVIKTKLSDKEKEQLRSLGIEV